MRQGACRRCGIVGDTCAVGQGSQLSPRPPEKLRTVNLTGTALFNLCCRANRAWKGSHVRLEALHHLQGSGRLKTSSGGACQAVRPTVLGAQVGASHF